MSKPSSCTHEFMGKHAPWPSCSRRVVRLSSCCRLHRCLGGSCALVLVRASRGGLGSPRRSCSDSLPLARRSRPTAFLSLASVIRCLFSFCLVFLSLPRLCSAPQSPLVALHIQPFLVEAPMAGKALLARGAPRDAQADWILLSMISTGITLSMAVASQMAVVPQ